LTKYSIKLNVNNKCIFFLRNKENFINLETEVFNKYFDLKETIEISKDDINENNNDTNDTDDTNDVNLTSDINKTNELLNKLLHNSNSENEENFEFNSELSYELYSYSEDEEEEDVSGCVISKVK
jgi:hypothetical protein